MDQHDLNALFNRVYNGQRNFMTPDVLKRGYRKGLAYELSVGEGFGGERLYGVTVLSPMGKKRHDLNACFDSLEKAEAHIKTLRMAPTNKS